ncbi:hypothetical protein MASR1M66_20900 [Aminivibrio sp.]
MEKKWRSSEVFEGRENAGARALWKSMGYGDDDFRGRPIIGIANCGTPSCRGIST